MLRVSPSFCGEPLSLSSLFFFFSFSLFLSLSLSLSLNVSLFGLFLSLILSSILSVSVSLPVPGSLSPRSRSLAHSRMGGLGLSSASPGDYHVYVHHPPLRSLTPPLLPPSLLAPSLPRSLARPRTRPRTLSHTLFGPPISHPSSGDSQAQRGLPEAARPHGGPLHQGPVRGIIDLGLIWTVSSCMSHPYAARRTQCIYTTIIQCPCARVPRAPPLTSCPCAPCCARLRLLSLPTRTVPACLRACAPACLRACVPACLRACGYLVFIDACHPMLSSTRGLQALTHHALSHPSHPCMSHPLLLSLSLISYLLSLIHAPPEWWRQAEAQCSKLVASGKAYATATEDMDALTFG